MPKNYKQAKSVKKFVPSRGSKSINTLEPLTERESAFKFPSPLGDLSQSTANAGFIKAHTGHVFPSPLGDLSQSTRTTTDAVWRLMGVCFRPLSEI